MVFGAISTVKSVLKTIKLEQRFKLFLTFDTKFSKEEEESNDES